MKYKIFKLFKKLESTQRYKAPYDIIGIEFDLNHVMSLKTKDYAFKEFETLMELIAF